MTRHRTAALVGNPNSGKSALFNALTGARQKIANYAGVTVERKAGRLTLPSGEPVELVDLPGAYAFDATSPDEEVTRRVVHGEFPGEAVPQVLVIVIDAANLERHLVFAQEVVALGRPTVVALNMMDLAERDGLTLDPEALENALGVRVVPTVAVRRRGLDELAAAIAAAGSSGSANPDGVSGHAMPSQLTLPERRLAARNIAKATILSQSAGRRLHQGLDRVLLNPWIGPLILLGILFVMFQAVYTWAGPFMDLIEGGLAVLQAGVAALVPEGWLLSLINDGVIAGVGAVLVFLPQIIILFAFILALEASGYMARAAFLVDTLMAKVGLNGRAFIPLLSSFACAIPGIMAARTIEEERDRLTTILIAPLMTCSARWPVYLVVIGAVIPATRIGGFSLQGLVAFGLMLTGVVFALIFAWLFKRTLLKGAEPTLLLEMPSYKVPVLRDYLLGLWERARIFIVRAGRVILPAAMLIWFLASYPNRDSGIEGTFAGMLGRVLQPIFAPIGFNLEMTISLIPAMAAREVAVGTLGTIYAVDTETSDAALGAVIGSTWTLPMGLAFLAWFVFAPQCISTLAIMRKETNGWKWPAFAFAYLTASAYIAALLTYHGAVALGL